MTAEFSDTVQIVLEEIANGPYDGADVRVNVFFGVGSPSPADVEAVTHNLKMMTI